MIVCGVTFSPLAISQYFEYDPDNPGEYAPLREGEKALIPLDTKDPAYNLWQTPRETFPLIRRLCAESNVVGFELVELLPYRVPGYETVLNSERIVRECLVGIAMRKKGIDEKAYLAPLTSDDGK